MFDGMLRISEACAAEVEHIEFATGGKHKGTATLEIPRSKTDQTGTEKATVYLSRATVKAIKQYMAFANITGGPLFRGFTSRHKNPSMPGESPPLQPVLPLKHGQKPLGLMG